MEGATTHAEVAHKLREAVKGAQRQNDRKLLRWSPKEWSDWEQTPRYGQLITPAKMLPIRAPLSTMSVYWISEVLMDLIRIIIV
jgi:hypothetical protein